MKKLDCDEIDPLLVPEPFFNVIFIFRAINISVCPEVSFQFLRKLLLWDFLFEDDDDEVLSSIYSFSICDHEFLHSPFRLKEISAMKDLLKNFIHDFYGHYLLHITGRNSYAKIIKFLSRT